MIFQDLVTVKMLSQDSLQIESRPIEIYKVKLKDGKFVSLLNKVTTISL